MKVNVISQKRKRVKDRCGESSTSAIKALSLFENDLMPFSWVKSVFRAVDVKLPIFFKHSNFAVFSIFSHEKQHSF
jgi:hypothetical protein